METRRLIGLLNDLILVETDALHSYNRALGDIEDEVIRARLTEFRDQHENHIGTLSDAVHALGETPPEANRDLKGYVLETFAALGGFIGLKGALKALKATEEITNRYYAEALPKDTPPTIRDILRRHLSEERIHLEYLDMNTS